MPTLMGLPNEILTAIIEAIEPDDIESFSNCCKLMYSLAKHRLEDHKQKRSLFSTVLISDVTLPYSDPLHDELFDTYLQGLLSDEGNRFYTKAMAVELFASRGASEDGGDHHSAGDTSAVNEPDGFEQQLESSMMEVHGKIGLETGGIEATEWGKHVKEGNHIAVFLFLLAFLPNLENLNIEYYSSWSLRLSGGYSKILSLMAKAALEQSKNGPSFGGRLSKCTVLGGGFVGLEKGILPFLMMLPRIQVFKGYHLSIEDCSWPYADAMSPIADLELHGEMDVCTLSSYLNGIKELKKFRYTHASDGYISFEPSEILATLRQSAFRSLVHLDLTVDAPYEITWSYGLPGIGSLRSFEVLETIRMQYILLFLDARVANSADVVDLAPSSENSCDETKIDGKILIDFLPSSARTFRLEDIAMRRLVLDIFTGFPEQRVERLPKLELISLDAGDEINTQIEEICRKSEVQMEVRQENIIFF